MFKAKSPKFAPVLTLASLIGPISSLAKQSGFLLRTPRKISPEGFLLSLLKSVCCGQASLNQLAMFFGDDQPDSPSKQAVHRRLGEASSRFLRAVLDRLMTSRLLPESGDQRRIFNRVLVEDSSQFKTHRSNHQSLPGMGNGSGSTAGGKVDSCIEMTHLQPILTRHTAARVQDRALGPDVLEHVKPGDLVLRDMGYFSLKDFSTIELQGAFWLSRLHALVKAKLANGKSLEEHLRSTPRNQIDTEVWLGEKGHKARIIAIRVEDALCAQRRRRRRAKSKKQGHAPRKESILRDEWSIYVTNIPQELLSSEAIVQLYAARWSIEIQFRSWKQATKVEAALNRITNRHHLDALLLAAMIFQVLSLRIAKELRRCSKGIRVSIEKVADWLCLRLLCVHSMTSVLPVDLRHLGHDRRKRTLLSDSLDSILCLS